MPDRSTLFTDRYAPPEGEVPENFAYQWVVHSVMGDTSFDDVPRYLLNGWKCVPVARHKAFVPFLSAGARRVEIDGLVLMQKSTKLVAATRTKERAAALRQAQGGASAGGSVIHSVIHLWPKIVRRPVPRWYRSTGLLGFMWRVVARGLGLTARQISTALDGTIPDRNTGLPIGIIEYRRRYRIMTRKRWRDMLAGKQGFKP